MTHQGSGSPRLRRAGAFGAGIGFVASAAWFLPGINELASEHETVLGTTVHFVVLLLIPAGTGAGFAVVLPILSAVFGPRLVLGALALISLLGPPYATWRKSTVVTSGTWLEGVGWAVAFVAFGFVATRLAFPGGLPSKS